MTKTILYVIAFVNILVSILTYQQRYFSMIESETLPKGINESVAFASCILFILSGISVITIIKSISKFKKYIIITCYLLIGIIFLAIQIQYSFIPTALLSIIVISSSIALITDTKEKTLIILNGLLLVLNAAWGMIFYI